MKRQLGLWIALSAVGLAARGAGATVHIVTDFGDSGAPGQLRSLISLAIAGDTIYVPPGTIQLTGAPLEDANATGDLDINKALTIVGAGAELTVIDADSNDRAVHVLGTGDVVLSGVTLRNGEVDPDGAGGGVVLNSGRLLLVSSIVEGGSSGGGGGIFNQSDATLALQGSTVRFNTASGITGAGAGILNFGKMEISESAIHENRTLGPSASGNGGGISNAGFLQIVNTTISGNVAFVHGGGIFQSASARLLVLSHSTLAFNQAGFLGGGLMVMGDVPQIGSTILGNNTAVTAGPDCSGTIDSQGHNLIGVAAGCTIGGTTTGNILNRNPLLFPLRDNGGPTLTHGLRARSRAIDAGLASGCPALDQRGVSRPQDGDGDGTVVCDIGAFEAAPR
jgi:hypothetical protein